MLTKRTTALLVLLAVGTAFLAGCTGEAPQEAREGQEESTMQTPDENESVNFQLEDEAEIGNRTADDADGPAR